MKDYKEIIEGVYDGKIKKGKEISNKFGEIRITWSQSRREPGGTFSAHIKNLEGKTIKYLSGYLRIGDITKDAKEILKNSNGEVKWYPRRNNRMRKWNDNIYWFTRKGD